MQIIKAWPDFVPVAQMMFEIFFHPKSAVALKALVDSLRAETEQAVQNLFKREGCPRSQHRVKVVRHEHKTGQPDTLLLQQPKQCANNFVGWRRLGQINFHTYGTTFRHKINVFSGVESMLTQVCRMGEARWWCGRNFAGLEAPPTGSGRRVSCIIGGTESPVLIGCVRLLFHSRGQGLQPRAPVQVSPSSCFHFSCAAASARPRWLMVFFWSAGISAKVSSNPSGTNSGS